MSQYVADVNLVSIIMDGSDESNFVAADIEDREFPDLIGVRKGLTQLHEIQKSALPHNHVPVGEGRFSIRVLFSELIQALPRNDVHRQARGYRTLFLVKS
jgi:hypothetical protein